MSPLHASEINLLLVHFEGKWLIAMPVLGGHGGRVEWFRSRA
jgi:hypothetical protein